MPNLSRRTVVTASVVLPITLGKPWTLSALELAAPPLEFVHNPIADFLHLLFFRSEKKRFASFVHEGFADVPRLDQLVAVPEAVASAGLTHYDQVLPYLEQQFSALPLLRIEGPEPKILSYSNAPPALDAIAAIIAAGSAFCEPFLRYWKANVEAQVVEQIAAWHRQDLEHKPLEKLLDFHKLSLRGNKLQVVAMPFHPAGSANYSPAAVYTSLFRNPDLGRVIGHEASHLLWSKAVGGDWKAHPRAADAERLAQPWEVDVEEAVCLFMQTELSRACGIAEKTYRISNDITDDEGLKAYLAALEADWPLYQEKRERWATIFDYVADKAQMVFNNGRKK
jgi:hypothetical protein